MLPKQNMQCSHLMELTPYTDFSRRPMCATHPLNRITLPQRRSEAPAQRAPRFPLTLSMTFSTQSALVVKALVRRRPDRFLNMARATDTLCGEAEDRSELVGVAIPVFDCIGRRLAWALVPHGGLHRTAVGLGDGRVADRPGIAGLGRVPVAFDRDYESDVSVRRCRLWVLDR